MCCAADNHNDTCHVCAKGILDSKLNSAVKFIYTIKNFHKIAPNFTFTHKNCIFFKHNWRLIQ